MMNERDVVYLRHIRDAAHQIQGYVQEDLPPLLDSVQALIDEAEDA
jgi:hypothetical protein